jgi:cardiolipin synthase A/B
MGAPRAIAERIASRLDPFLRPRFSIGNRVRLLATGQQYFPALFEAIEAAQRSVHLETYIFADDAIGHRMIDALAVAAQRGVEVRVLIDGFGGGDFGRKLAAELPGRGVHVRIYRPERAWRPRRRLLRRLHRKIAVIDDRIAFVGGININEEPRRDGFTREAIGPRFDLAVRCEGPVVVPIANAARRLWWAVGVAGWSEVREPAPRRVHSVAPLPDGVRAALVLRDNLRNRHSIERSYLAAIRGARREILLACAYFLPGKRFRRALVGAARRGVRVRLLLQGRVEYRLQHFAQRALYGQLLEAGIEIHEYRPSYLHAKAAVVDGQWSTVGSSNIDPLSLLLAREANIVVRDPHFGLALGGLVGDAMERESWALHAMSYARRSFAARVRDWLAYGIVRALTVVLARGTDY